MRTGLWRYWDGRLLREGGYEMHEGTSTKLGRETLSQGEGLVVIRKLTVTAIFMIKPGVY